LRALLVAPRPSAEVLEAVDGLLRRSLIERGKLAGSFTLQAVVLEYLTMRLIAEASRELEQGRLARLIEHCLVQAHAKDYVRQAQERLLLAPLLTRWQSASQERDREAQVGVLLDKVHTWSEHAQGYGPANLLALLRELRGHLRGLDLSHLFIRGAYLQGVEMQDTTLAGATLQESIFTEPARESPHHSCLILTHILQINFAKEPGKATRIVEISRTSALSSRLSRSFSKMWVRIRPRRAGVLRLKG